MEKKTIGAFISALRRANGMTQQELGDRLYVSDKTVSRWERDESTPDLSLIPVIADLFGVTADELLRGERRQPSPTVAPLPMTADAEDAQELPSPSPAPDARSERQFRLLLERRGTKYKNFSLISVAVALVGLMLAAIVNLGFLRGYIALGLCIIFSLGALITQLCLANAFYLYPDEEDHDHVGRDNPTRADRMRGHNRRVTMTVVRVCYLLIGILAFCLPLGFVGDAHFGMEFGAWLLTGGICALAALLLAALSFVLWIRPRLIRKGLLNDSEQEAAYHAAHRRLVRRITAIGLAGGIVWGIALGTLMSIPSTELVKPEVFDNHEDFKDFMAQKDHDTAPGFYLSGYIEDVDVPVEVLPDGTVIVPDGIELEKLQDLEKYYSTPLHNCKGQELFTYINRREGYVLQVSDADDALPISVWTNLSARAGNVRALISGVGTAVLIAYLLALLILYRTRVARLKET